MSPRQLTVARLSIAVFLVSLTVGCAKEPRPPRTVSEFVEDPIQLEATMVRCAQDRSRTKYDAECVNAREAGNRLAAKDREARLKELEAQSERKRKALRRTQEAAARARRRAAEAQRQREVDEYLGVFESIPRDSANTVPPTQGNIDAAVKPETEVLQGNQPGVAVSLPAPEEDADSVEDSSPPASDIDSIRDELRRRQDSSD